MDTWWVNWPLAIAFLYFTVKAYGHLRDVHGTDDNNWLEGAGALWLAPLVAPFMPFIMVKSWWRRRRAEASERVPVRNA